MCGEHQAETQPAVALAAVCYCQPIRAGRRSYVYVFYVYVSFLYEEVSLWHSGVEFLICLLDLCVCVFRSMWGIFSGVVVSPCLRPSVCGFRPHLICSF